MPDTDTHRAAGIAFDLADVIERPEPPFFGNGRVQCDPFVFGLLLGLVPCGWSRRRSRDARGRGSGQATLTDRPR